MGSQIRRGNENVLSQVQDDVKQTSKYTLKDEEAHRFRAILGEAVERLSLLGLVGNSSRANKRDQGENRSAQDEKRLDKLMRKQKDLEKQYERLMHKRWTLRGLANKSKF